MGYLLKHCLNKGGIHSASTSDYLLTLPAAFVCWQYCLAAGYPFQFQAFDLSFFTRRSSGSKEACLSFGSFCRASECRFVLFASCGAAGSKFKAFSLPQRTAFKCKESTNYCITGSAYCCRLLFEALKSFRKPDQASGLPCL